METWTLEMHWAAGGAIAAGAVVVALAVDALWGEPPVGWHPVAWMGRALAFFGQRIAPDEEREHDPRSFVLAALAWCGLAAGVCLLAAWLQAVLLRSLPAWTAALVLGLLLKPLLAWRMLRDEVLAVQEALARSLAAGRERLSWLVSRDTAALDAAQVRESAIETLAENLCDSVVAPLLWFALLGLPGAALYRFANTADAMWGYPGWRGQGAARRHWRWAGRWAARADDVLSWLPARLTAVLLLLGGARRASRRVSGRELLRDARSTPSPNGGWPMGAMAQLLGVRLGKPGVYVLNPRGGAPQAAHVPEAVALARRAVRTLGAAACAALLAGGALEWWR